MITLDQITVLALGMPTAARAKLAEQLWDSLEDAQTPKLTEADIQELQRRDRQISADQVRCFSHDEAMAKVREALSCLK